VPTALRTLVDGGIRHFLALLEAALALIAKVLVGWQEFLLKTILSAPRSFGFESAGIAKTAIIFLGRRLGTDEHSCSDEAYWLA
jgi:hypothetical protein